MSNSQVTEPLAAQETTAALTGIRAQIAYLLQGQGYQLPAIIAITSALNSYSTASQLFNDLLLDGALQTVTCSLEETVAAIAQFYEERGVAEAARRAWCDRQGLAPQEINALVLRQLKVRKFQIATWGADLNAYFLRRKPQLDRVIYSYLEAADPEIAQELYFRIVNGEQEFSDAAKQYAQGPEALTGGLVGPLELGQLHPALAELLRASTPGQLHLPVALDGKTIVVRLEQWFPARFDQATGDRLYQELLQAWLEQQRAALPVTSHFSPQPLDGPACSPNGCQG